MAARQKILFLTCTGEHLPDVSQYEFGKHLGIVYDEAKPQMILNNKEIFQGLPEWSSISDTHTHRYQSKVCLNGVRQILTCNDWWDQYKTLSPAQQLWFDTNVIVIATHEPLWTNIPMQGPAEPLEANEETDLPFNVV